MGIVIRLEHADLEFPGYFASVGAEVTGTGMVHLCVGSEPEDDGNSAVVRLTADGAEELARTLMERASVARRRQALAGLESVILEAGTGAAERLRQRLTSPTLAATGKTVEEVLDSTGAALDEAARESVRRFWEDG
jgi:hypothetical protein